MKEVRRDSEGNAIIVTTKTADVVDWALYTESQIGLRDLTHIKPVGSPQNIFRHPAFSGRLESNPPVVDLEHDLMRATFQNAKNKNPHERARCRHAMVIIKGGK